MRYLLLGLCSLLLASPAAAAWSEARSRHFIIYSEQKPAELRNYAERLERFDAAVRAARSMPDPVLTDGSRLTIYVLRTMGAVADLNSFGAPGFYIGRAGGSLAVVTSQSLDTRNGRYNPEETFFHEYTHHLMLGDQKTALPMWMIEGFAEFYSTAQIKPDGAVVIGAPPLDHATVLLRDLGFSARHLLAGREPEERFDRASVYAKGWLLTHYLMFEPARAGQLASYLSAMNRGTPAEQAASAAFGDLRKLDTDLDRYAASKSFRAVQIPSAAAPQVTIRPLSAGLSAIMRVRVLSDRGTARGKADELAALARKTAAPYPADAVVQGILAEAEFDAGRHADAIAAADRALSVDPDQVQSLIYKGRALMALGKSDPAKADWTTIRRLFIKANRADTENADPLWLYYQSFAAAGQRPTNDAVKGMLYAHVLAPQDRGLRFTAVRELLRGGDYDKAERAFGPLVFDPHLSPGRKPLLTHAMQRIQARDGAGAIAALEADFRAGPSRS